ncbi:MAG TPA: amino acid adenylation domain-containing protein [Ktedonobacterales bacterium]|jgi:amino acid adenylation domain-containing protein
MSDTSNLSEAKRALLDKLMRGNLPQATTGIPAISRRTQTGFAPLSFGQQQLWLLAQMMPDIPVYNECVTIHLPGPLDVATLEQSFNEFIKRHEAWRTSFPLVDGQPVQMVHPPSTVRLPLVDLRRLPEAEREAEALRLATEDARILFDLAQGPLLRALFIQLADEEHRLFLTMHHIIFDGVAIYQVFLPELRALYEAFLAGQPSPLPPLEIEYTDYAAWQREWLPKEKFDDQLVYWKKQLEGAPATLELPFDRPRPPAQTYAGSMRPFAIGKPLTDALKALSRQEGVTFYILLAAAFNTLLYRYTAQDDMVIGTATGGRKRPEVERMIGFFLNTLVLRTNLSGAPTFRELLMRVREVTTSAITYEEVPFEYLIKELQLERNLAQNPLFQVLLTLEPPLTALPSGWTLTQMDVTVGTSKFDLSLELDDRPEGLIGRFEYNSDLFDRTTIERMVGHWQTLLESIVADPNRPLSALPILTPAEQKLLEEWNATQRAFPTNVCIHQLFEEQAARTPQATAVIYEGAAFTYQELNARANQLAHYLRQLGVGPDVLVGLCLERSLEMEVGLLGILKAGGAYVPLDPTYPAERLAFMLTDAQVPVLVTQATLASLLPTQNAQVVRLDADARLLAEQDQTNPASLSTAENLVYVIYTSGSTGRPKGVQILQRTVVNFLLSMRERPGLTAEDTWLAVTTLSFDIAALELFLPLLVGARVVIASRETAVSGTVLAETMARTGTTVMQATPVTWRLLLEAGWSGDPRLKMLCGGEALPRDLAQQLLNKCASLWNLYGPTETTIWSTIRQITPDTNLITIGVPIANTQVYLLDASLQPVPIGVSGELYIGGAGLARGYLNRPELTAERFVPDPFSADPGARLYRTGDLARYLPTGEIDFLGRLDHQVKVRGFRIELGEVETLLRQHPAIRAAVVVAREDTPGDKRLVAYFVAGEGDPPAHAGLRSFLKEYLPDYMIPSAFVMVEQMPLTPNGKVDRRALPAPDTDHLVRDEIGALPSTPMEIEVAAILAGFLKVEQVGLDENFFMIGVNSLLGTQAIARMNETFKVKLSLRTLFDAPTVRELAATIEEVILTKLETLSDEELQQLLS